MNKIPLIIGLGRTGVSLVKHLAQSEETLYICESSPNDKYLNELKDLDIQYILNPEISERTFQLISRIYPSPGVSIEHEVFQYAKNLKIPIHTDMDIYLRNSQSYNILVTGTNGKTTTVSMLEHLLQGFLKDKSISAIGNIGKPVLDFLDQKIQIAIIEVSSFQIEASSGLKSEIGILLNVEEDHIDRHKSFKIYKSLKLRVLQESNINISKLENKIIGKELRSLNESLNAMGAVNLAAPEEYAALKERIDFLKSQSEDLQKAVDDLKETIKDINIESRRRFREMFDQVNENFMNVFSSLFEGGEAKLLLTESEDLLNAGVDILAQPPGKKLQNINLLSGGEKALTAISLIFAIFLVKPSPFCLLDEVDAPLDDVNVVRFNRLITGLSYDSQFIIVTHNKKTMEIGDLLYGVTMEEPGISKTVSVEFKEAESLIA